MAFVIRHSAFGTRLPEDQAAEAGAEVRAGDKAVAITVQGLPRPRQGCQFVKAAIVQIPTSDTGQIPTSHTGQIPTPDTGRIPTSDTG